MTTPLIEAMIRDNAPAGILADALKDANPAWQEGDPLAILYAVTGHTEDIDGYEEQWIVAAFLDESKANKLREKLNKWLWKRNIHYDNPGPLMARRKVKPPKDDPAFRLKYGGVYYLVVRVELRS